MTVEELTEYLKRNPQLGKLNLLFRVGDDYYSPELFPVLESVVEDLGKLRPALDIDPLHQQFLVAVARSEYR